MKRLNINLPAVIVFLLLFFQGVSSGSGRLEIYGLDGGIRQGDTALVTIRSTESLDRISGEFNGKRLHFSAEDDRTFTAIIGAEMDMNPGRYELAVAAENNGGNSVRNVGFEILERKYSVEKLSLPEKMVTPDMSVIERIRRESAALGRVKMMVSGERFWAGDFVMPVDGRFADNFGARRVLNGVSKKPHSGVDIKASAGTPVKSPNGGKVVFVDIQYYGGKTVVVDHGHGLSTLYMHLSKILVNHGDEVKKGEVIGLVGSTGRSTGPHLHWGAYLYGEKVDPSSLLKLAVESRSAGRFAPGARESSSKDRLGGND